MTAAAESSSAPTPPPPSARSAAERAFTAFPAATAAAPPTTERAAALKRTYFAVPADAAERRARFRRCLRSWRRGSAAVLVARRALGVAWRRQWSILHCSFRSRLA